MKTNAIVRIVIYSILILVLSGILLGFLQGKRLHEESEPVLQTEIPASSVTRGIVIADTQVYSSPTTKGNEVGQLFTGDEVQINTQEKTNGEHWALISTPCSGWVMMKNIQVEQGDLAVGPVASDETTTMGAVNAQKIKNLDIDWAFGSITILPGKQMDTIRFQDDYSGDEKYHLYYTTKGDTLKIQFCKDDWEDMNFGIHFGSPLEKNLTVEVPESWLCSSLEIDAASAKLEVHDLTINEVEIDSASGAIGFKNCNVARLDVDTASGDVIFTGSLVEMDCDSASASIVANLQNVPQAMDLDTASGNLDITLPEDAGFSVKLDTMSGKFQSDFDYEVSNNRYICGNGSCTIDVSAMSGNVHIRKNTNVTSADTTHHHTDACINDPNCPDYHHSENHH